MAFYCQFPFVQSDSNDKLPPKYYQNALKMGSTSALRNYWLWLRHTNCANENIEKFITDCENLKSGESYLILIEIFEKGHFGQPIDIRRVNKYRRQLHEVKDDSQVVTFDRFKQQNIAGIFQEIHRSFSEMRNQLGQLGFGFGEGLCWIVSEYAVDRPFLRLQFNNKCLYKPNLKKQVEILLFLRVQIQV